MLERRFKNLAGLEDFSADVMGQRLHVKYDAAQALGGGDCRRGRRHRHARVARTRGADRRQRAADARPPGARRGRPGAALGVGLALLAGARSRAGCVPRVLFGVSIAAGVAADGAQGVERRCASASLDINVLMIIAVAGAMPSAQ